ncbi:MAG: hydrogenase maturation protease [Betaproteobacteria bacterium]|nr:hydrogenase maturation protease [Betaproteobacteria bacterium]
MTAPVVIFAVGNPSRGDDALGPLLAGRLAAWLEAEGLRGRIEIVEDFQLQIEHALDLEGRQLALFIDAGAGTPAPFVLRRIAPSAAVAHSTHALAPEAVLEVFRRTMRQEPPPSYVLCVAGAAFGLGEPLTAAAGINADAAFAKLQALCRAPELPLREEQAA